ncbi:MAG: YHS domain-containing protein [Planctomycetota bacterium]
MKIRLLMISLSILILGMAIYSAGCEKKVDAPVQESTAKACPADCMKPCCVAETVWTCTMHPQILEEKAGKCSMCAMNLIPVEPDADKVEQTLCPVMGNPINKEVFIEYKGKKVYFCCPGCDEKFTADPEKYLGKLPQFE